MAFIVKKMFLVLKGSIVSMAKEGILSTSFIEISLAKQVLIFYYEGLLFYKIYKITEVGPEWYWVGSLF